MFDLHKVKSINNLTIDIYHIVALNDKWMSTYNTLYYMLGDWISDIAADRNGYGVTTEHPIHTFIIMHGYIPYTFSLRS